MTSNAFLNTIISYLKRQLILLVGYLFFKATAYYNKFYYPDN